MIERGPDSRSLLFSSAAILLVVELTLSSAAILVDVELTLLSAAILVDVDLTLVVDFRQVQLFSKILRIVQTLYQDICRILE